jgi:nucleoporin NUP82
MDERRAADQQYEWVQEIDNEEPFLLESTDSLGEFEVRLRPQNPSAIPRLQGPFAIQPEDDAADMEISDIYVHAASIDERDLLAGEDDDDFDQFTSHGVPFTTICVATTDNEVWFAMDLDGVSGQWLPKKGKSAFGVPSSDAKELTLIDTFALDDAGANTQDNWPMFTCDVAHNYSVFLTTSKQIYSFSLNDWVTRLAAEMTGTEAVDPGMRTRLETACDSQICITNRLVGVEDPTEMLSAPTVVDDVSLGYLLLSATPSSAYSVVFDQAHLQASTIGPSSPELMATPASRQIVAVPEQPENNDVETLPTRSPYVPAKIFYANHLYPIEHLKQRLPPNLKRAMTENPMRLSPAMLEIMTVTHRTISGQSAELEKAAAELFRRCERLREELGGQVQQMAELAQRLQHLKSSEEVDEDGNVTAKKSVDARIRDAQERQAKLSARYETLRRKVGRVGSAKRELSSKEKTWIDEIDALGHDVGIGGEGEDERNADARLDRRFGRVRISLSASSLGLASKQR